MDEQRRPGEEEEKEGGPLTSLVVGTVGALSVLFLLNPGAGIFLEIPDNIPVIGNLDEAAAVALLISCLSYFGFDHIGRLFGKAGGNEHSEGDVIDVEADDR